MLVHTSIQEFVGVRIPPENHDWNHDSWTLTFVRVTGGSATSVALAMRTC
ncbi:MAG: hypothetical protein ACR2O4_02480 [Hyphomicrobiaceae bacterium]